MTIAGVIRNEIQTENEAAESKHMERCGTLREWSQMIGERFIWLGGFKRFAKIECVRADWWVVEGSGWVTSSWCCCPDTPVFQRRSIVRHSPIQSEADRA